MKRTPLKRRTPLRPASKRLAAERRRYTVLRAEFLARPENQWCPVWDYMVNNGPNNRGHSQPRPTSDIHHKKGRVGSLLNDTRYWLAVSRVGHQWLHDHPNQARERGWLW